MTNRILLRIKVIQILYSFYKGDKHNIEKVEAELFHSIEETYVLYCYLLHLVNCLTDYANEKLEKRKHAYVIHPHEHCPSVLFIKNRFVAQLAANKELRKYIDKQGISWEDHPVLIRTLYDEIVESDFYAQYLKSKRINDTYKKDRDFWCHVFRKIFSESEMLTEELEEISIYWNDDVEIVISFIIKTIKLFEEDNGENQPLLPLFKDNEDRVFVQELFRNAINHDVEYRNLIQEHAKNWEIDRLAFMDSIILQAAIAEVCTFPTIPINVTINEYIEISKYYSTEKSSDFINGILDSVANKLKEDNKITKIAYYTPN